MEHEHENINGHFWLNKKAKISILKDGRNLIFTATILEIDQNHITFRDRDNQIFSFNRGLVQEMTEIFGEGG